MNFILILMVRFVLMDVPSIHLLSKRLFKLRQANHNVILLQRPIRDLLPVIPEFADDTLIGGNGSIISKMDKSKLFR